MAKSPESPIKGIYCNREYSWLLFDRRVLDQASDLTNPLLERRSSRRKSSSMSSLPRSKSCIKRALPSIRPSQRS